MQPSHACVPNSQSQAFWRELQGTDMQPRQYREGMHVLYVSMPAVPLHVLSVGHHAADLGGDTCVAMQAMQPTMPVIP